MSDSQKIFKYKDLGIELQRIRGEVDMKVFAEFLGISLRSLYRYEDGERKIPKGLLKKVGYTI